jgi:murein DD-endopeptidase MepM/ murein hydrolase activator NlpD
MPQGTLRFGKRTAGKTVNGHDAQFYGLLDDIAIFAAALTPNQIRNLRDNVPHLTGKESGLLAGYTFAQKKSPPKLGRPITLHGAAQRVVTSAARDNDADASLLPLPSQHRPMDLPFPLGEEWSVIQGPDNPTGSHYGYAAFCWDFMVAGQPQSGTYPNGTGGAPFYACAPGTVENVDESASSGSPPSNLVEVKQGPDEYCAYLHLQQNGAFVNKNDPVTQGQKLALTGDTGVKKGANHIHLAVADDLDQTPGFVTFPVAFGDYELKTADGKWQSVARGMPSSGQVIRIPPAPTFGPRSLQAGSAVARGPNLLDVVATDTKGRAWIARWKPNTYARNWDRWRPVLADIAVSHTPVGLVARGGDKLDVFVAGQDGKTYTGAWDQHVAAGQWRGWWNILTGAIPPGGVVTAVSRDPHKLDVFLVSTDGTVYTAAWDQHAAGGAWQGWWPIKGLRAKPGARVTAVARDPHKLDIFVTAFDGKVYTAAWDQHVADGAWRGWWPVRNLVAADGAPVTVVARDSGKLDVFAVGNDGGVYTAAWDHRVADGKWRGWWRVGTLAAKPGTPVAAVSRQPHNLDLFVVANDNRVYTAAWDHKVADGKWRGWWPIGRRKAKAGSAVAAVSRAPLKLDVFVVGSNGNLYTAAWDHQAADGEWQGWWSIGT